MSEDIRNKNPWWNKAFKLDVLPIGNNEFELAKNKLSNSSSLVIQGFLGIGKTFLMKRLIQEMIKNLHIQPHRIIYIDCTENIDTGYILNLIEANSPYKTYLFLDNIDQPIESLKKIVDKHSSLLKIVCSTSQKTEYIKVIFTNKIEIIEMLPCSFQDYIVAITKKIPSKCSFELLKEASYLSYLESFLIFGGYPSVIFAKTDEEKINILKNGTQQILNNSSEHIGDALQYLSMNMGSLLNICDLADSIGRSRYKTDQDISIIEDLKIASFLSSFDTSIKKSLVKSYKIFFHDIGYRNSLINSFNKLSLRQDKLELYLNFTALCLANAPYTTYISFFRTTNQTEINFIVETNTGIIPTQVSIGKIQKNIPRIFKSFLKQESRKIDLMLVVTEDLLKEEKIDNTKILFIPAHLLSFWNGR